jgi:uncharacterized protein YxeA
MDHGEKGGSISMKKRLIFALALVVLTVFTGLGVAQEKAFGAETQHLYLKITGKVIKVDEKAKTFTVTSKGQSVTFNAAKLPGLPKVGEIIDITYTQTPGGPNEATNLNTSRSNIY